MEIAVEDAESLSYHRFCKQYMEKNRPVRIKNITKGWSSSLYWKTAKGSLNFQYLRAIYGDEMVPVCDFANIAIVAKDMKKQVVQGRAHAHESHTRTLVNFREYLQQVESQTAGLTYLKDWHFHQCCQKRGFKPEYTYVKSRQCEVPRLTCILQERRYTSRTIGSIGRQRLLSTTRHRMTGCRWSNRKEMLNHRTDDYRFLYFGTPSHLDQTAQALLYL